MASTAHKPETLLLVDSVERFAERKLGCGNEIAYLIDLGAGEGLNPRLEELVFYAKFISGAKNIIKREGSDSSQAAKVVSEFKSVLEKSSLLVRALVADAPEDVRALFHRRFLEMTHESLNSLVELLCELAWVKNYLLSKGNNASL